jgi:hypothetical protein
MVRLCQCLPTCKNKPVEGSPFCAKHLKFCPRKAPLSGYEPLFDPEKYNRTRRIRESHNCFAYAFNHIDIPSEKECNEVSCSTPFHQPGRKTGFPKWNKIDGKRCPDLLARLFADVPGLKRTKFTKRCPRGSSKIALVVDPKEDYHFYRQDRDGWWSHKPGATHVKRTDADDIQIYDPSLASRDYTRKSGRLNYQNFCGYLCAPTRKHFFKRGGKRTTRRRSRTHSRSQH